MVYNLSAPITHRRAVDTLLIAIDKKCEHKAAEKDRHKFEGALLIGRI